MFAVIDILAIVWWVVTTVAISYGLAYLGGVLLSPDKPKAPEQSESGQSRLWNPHTTRREGLSKPRSYGKNLHHGNIVGNWTDVIDNREVLYLLVDHGGGPTKGVVIVDGEPQIWLNDQPITNFTDVEYQERLGTMNQDCMAGFEQSKLEYRMNTPLLKDEPVLFTTPNEFFDDIEYTIIFPEGLRRYGSEGKVKLSTCRIQVHIRVIDSGEGGWVELLDTTFEEKTLEPCFKTYKVSVQGYNCVRGTQYDLKLTNKTGTKERHVNSVSLRSVREVIDTAFTYPGQALIGIRAVATARLSGSIDVKVIREDRIINTFDGTDWSLEWNNNRAWVTWDALTLPAIDGDGTPENPYKILRYDGTEPQYLDRAFFHKWAIFCDGEILSGYGAEVEHRCDCNIIIDEITNTLELAYDIAAIGRATLYWQGHLLTGWVDDIVAERKDLVTMDSIMHKSWKNIWAIEEELAGTLEVFYKDEKLGFERTPATKGGNDIEGYKSPITLEGVGIISRGVAIHYLHYLLERNRLIRNKNQFQVHKVGFLYKLGDVIRLQCRIANWGKGWRVKSSTVNTITVNKTVTTKVSAGDGLFIRSYKAGTEEIVTHTYEVDSVAGKVITVTEDWDVTPVKGNLVATGAAGDIKLRRIIKKTSTSDNYFNIEVETYDEVLFSADLLNPANPNANYKWPTPIAPLSAPITRAEMEDYVKQMIPPLMDVNVPLPSNLTWSDNDPDDNWISWSATNPDEPIIFWYKGVSYEIDPGSTLEEFVYWNPAANDTFQHTPNADVAVLLGRWYMCRNVGGTAYPTVPFSSMHAGVLQAGTITATLGQIGDLAVDTLQIAGEAVTKGVSAYTNTGWVTGDVQEVTITTTGQPVNIIATVKARGIGRESIWVFKPIVKLKRDANIIYDSGATCHWMGGIGAYGYVMKTVMYRETPVAGTYTYKLNVSGNDSTFAKRFLYAQEVKK